MRRQVITEGQDGCVWVSRWCCVSVCLPRAVCAAALRGQCGPDTGEKCGGAGRRTHCMEKGKWPERAAGRRVSGWEGPWRQGKEFSLLSRPLKANGKPGGKRLRAEGSSGRRAPQARTWWHCGLEPRLTLVWQVRAAQGQSSDHLLTFADGALGSLPRKAMNKCVAPSLKARLQLSWADDASSADRTPCGTVLDPGPGTRPSLQC